MAGSAAQSPRKTRLPLTGVVVLAVVVLAASATIAGASHQVARTVAVTAEVAAVVALVLAVVYIRGKYSAAMEEAEQRVADSQRLAAEVKRRAAEMKQQDQKRRAQAGARWSVVERAADQLLRVQLPAALAGKAAPSSLPVGGSDASAEAAELFEPLTAAVTSGVAELRQDLEEGHESARLAVVTLARRVQASAHRIQEEVTRMTQRHLGDADVLESGMRVDHAAAQQARHAQSVAVLCGEWPGQQWPEPLALVDVARAASGRIVPYQRVGVSGEPDIAATASAAEPLIHLVAELLANAAQSSPPSTQVLVTVRIVQRGAVIEIDDGGVGMEEHELERAREIASGRRLAGLGDLGEIPQTGLAVVGHYARRHGFGVDLMPSPYGGVRAVVLVPTGMLETLEPAGSVLGGQSGKARSPMPRAPEPGESHVPPSTAAEPGVAPAPADATPAGTDETPADSTATGASGVPAGPAGTGAERDAQPLPQRQSRRGQTASPSPAPAAAISSDPPPDAPSPAEAGAWMGAYLGKQSTEHDASAWAPADGATNASVVPADGGDAGA
jgi:signal transduction histidine kinase